MGKKKLTHLDPLEVKDVPGGDLVVAVDAPVRIAARGGGVELADHRWERRAEGPRSRRWRGDRPPRVLQVVTKDQQKVDEKVGKAEMGEEDELGTRSGGEDRSRR